MEDRKQHTWGDVAKLLPVVTALVTFQGWVAATLWDWLAEDRGFSSLSVADMVLLSALLNLVIWRSHDDNASRYLTAARACGRYLCCLLVGYIAHLFMG